MKKLITLSLLGVSLSVLINCSPKTAKTTASSGGSEAPRTSPAPGATAPASTSSSSSSTSGNAAGTDANKPWSGKSPEEVVAMYANTNPQRLENGKQLYESNCKKCHELHSPSSRTGVQWVKVMEKMGPKANLNVPQYMTVSAYLVNNAK